MDRFLNMIKSQAAAMDRQGGQPRMGIVESVDPSDQTVRVRWDEQGTLSGWLPLAVQSAGGGWGVVSMPQPGAQAFVVPDMGDLSSGVVVGFVHSSQAPAPKVQGYKQTLEQPPQPGETVMRHASGTFIRLRADGTIEMRGNLVVMGDVTVTGEIRDLDGLRGSVEQLRAAYNAHGHTGVRAGPDVSGLTTRPVP